MTGSPLGRYTVLDLTRARAGPTAVRYLADWGADVIQVENPGGDDFGFGSRASSDFQNLHRNKRTMTLNLKEAEGKAIFMELVGKADVVVENFRADVKHRLDIDHESLKAVNPRIVLASISGFGQDGPYARRPGFDQIAQGMGGLMGITGLAGEGPMRAGAAVADVAAGLNCAIGILIALLEREQSGEGQWVHTSLLEAMISMCDFQAARWTVDHEVPPQSGNMHPTSMPMGVFRCSDGHINIAGPGDRMFASVCDVLGVPELAEDSRFAQDSARHANRDALVEEIEQRSTAMSCSELTDALLAQDVPAGPIYQMDEVFADPQVRHLGVASSVASERYGRDIDLLGQAIHMSRTPFAMRHATHEKGEDTDSLLAGLGYDGQAIAALREKGVI